MKRSLTIALLSILYGCSTSVPVIAKFPVMPETLLVKCTELKKMQDDVKLSEVAKTIAENYTLYHECAIKHDATIEWYNVQKQIFESVK